MRRLYPLIIVIALLLCSCGAEVSSPTTVAASTAISLPVGGDLPAMLLPGLANVALRETAAPAGPGNGETLTPPDWVKPGVRVTFYSAAASVAQSRYGYVEDPDGDLVDPISGKHYRRTDSSSDGMGTASGDGFSQVDVLAVEGSNVVLSMALYGIDHTNNQFVPTSAGGAKVAGASIEGAWMHPKVLAQLKQTGIAGLLMLVGDYKLNGATYQSISFVSNTPGAYQSYTYDSKTGILLAANTSTAGATSPITMAGEGPPQGNTQLTLTRFGGMRQRTMPGINGANPSWLTRTSKLSYSGTYNFTNPVDPGSASVTYPLSVAAQFSKGGKNWAPYTATMNIQMPGSQPSKGNGVTGTTGLYWYDVAALKAMKAGQLLDRDPITGEQIRVQAIKSQSGGKVVIINTQLPGSTANVTYDQTSGVLLAYELYTASNGTTLRFQLQGRP